MNSGVLKYVSPTEIGYKPFMGGKVMLNGSLVDIPASGFPGGSPSLSAGTHYYVTLEIVSAVPTLTFHDASAASHATSETTGNVGTEILVISGTPDDTKSLLGQVYTDASGHFVSDDKHAWVRSWFNDGGLALQSVVDNGGNSSDYVRFPADGSFYEIVTAVTGKDLHHHFLSWADEMVESLVSGEWHGEASNAAIEYGISVDGDDPSYGNRMQGLTDGNSSIQTPHSGHRLLKLAEGPHDANVLGLGQAGTWSGGDNHVYFGGLKLYATRHYVTSRRFVGDSVITAPPPPPPPPPPSGSLYDAIQAAGLTAGLKAYGPPSSLPLTLTSASWMDNLHKDGAQFTILLRMTPTASRSGLGTSGLYGNRGGGGSETGVYASILENGQLRAGVHSSGNGALLKTSDSSLTLGVAHDIAVSINENGNGFLWCDGQYLPVGSTNEWAAAYTSPSTGSASCILQIGSWGNNVLPLILGDSVTDFAIWEGVALTKSQLDSI